MSNTPIAYVTPAVAHAAIVAGNPHGTTAADVGAASLSQCGHVVAIDLGTPASWTPSGDYVDLGLQISGGQALVNCVAPIAAKAGALTITIPNITALRRCQFFQFEIDMTMTALANGGAGVNYFRAAILDPAGYATDYLVGSVLHDGSLKTLGEHRAGGAAATSLSLVDVTILAGAIKIIMICGPGSNAFRVLRLTSTGTRTIIGSATKGLWFGPDTALYLSIEARCEIGGSVTGAISSCRLYGVY